MTPVEIAAICGQQRSSSGQPVDGKRIMKMFCEPTCAARGGGCRTSLPAKTGTTRRRLRESWGQLRETWMKLREARDGSRGLGETLGRPEGNFGLARGSERLGGNLEDQGVVPGWGSGPGNRTSGQVSWTGGRTDSVRIADCPGGPARWGNRRVSLTGLARPLHLIHAGASSFLW